jgi:hypothetical protein
VAIITPGIWANAINLSMSGVDVTQTGHPGPDTISIGFGSSCLIPKRKIATVCPPQNSMNRTGCFEFCFIRASSPFAASLARNSVTYFKSYLPVISIAFSRAFFNPVLSSDPPNFSSKLNVPSLFFPVIIQTVGVELIPISINWLVYR